HVTHELPPALKELWAITGVGVAEEHTGRPIAELDHNEFVGWVRDIAQLRDMAEAAQATRAVFAAARGAAGGGARPHRAPAPGGAQGAVARRASGGRRGAARRAGPQPVLAGRDGAAARQGAREHG